MSFMAKGFNQEIDFNTYFTLINSDLMEDFKKLKIVNNFLVSNKLNYESQKWIIEIIYGKYL